MDVATNLMKSTMARQASPCWSFWFCRNFDTAPMPQTHHLKQLYQHVQTFGFLIFLCSVPRMQLFENARLIAGRWQHWTFRGFRQAYTCVITFWWRKKSKNPPAPKVPRRQRRVSLAASDTGRAGRGGHFRQSRPPKSARDCRLSRFAQFADRLKIIQLHRFDPTWPQHWLDLGSTSASKAPTSAQLGSKMAQLGSKTAQLGPKFDLFGSKFGPSWRPHYGFKMGGWAK